MERILLDNYYINNEIIFSNNKEKYFVLIDGQKINSDTYKILIKEGVDVNVLVLNLAKEISLDFDMLDDSILHIEAIFEKELENVKITANLAKNASITGYFADFSTGNYKVKTDIYLKEDGSSCDWHIASLSKENDTKEFETSIYHIGQKTYGLSDCYGVSKDESKLVFSGVSAIAKNSKFSKTHQNAKIMVFDEASKAIAKPILKIDENEIEASHGASVGKVSDETLFYLTSRGLPSKVAKELITLGYLKPIMNGFIDEDSKEIITKLIERRM